MASRLSICGVILIGIVLGAGGTAWADATQSNIVEATGQAFLGDSDTPKTARQSAVANAMDKALRQVQTHVSSYARMEDFVLDKSIAEAVSSGVLTVIEERDLGLDGRRYQVWIKAKVLIAVEADPQQTKSALIASAPANAPTRDAALPSMADFSNPNAPLAVMVSTDRSSYREGELMKVYLQGNKDFSALVVYKDSCDNLIQVLPNAFRTATRFRGGQRYEIPGRRDQFELEISPPFGDEQILLYASTGNLSDLPGDQIPAGLKLLHGDAASVEDFSLRGLKLKRKSPSNQIPNAMDYGEKKIEEFYQAQHNVNVLGEDVGSCS